MIPIDAERKYLEHLTGKVFKILPLKEENCSTLKDYLDGLVVEMSGVYSVCDNLVNNPKFLGAIGSIAYLRDNEFDKTLCKREVFKVLSVIGKIKEV